MVVIANIIAITHISCELTTERAFVVFSACGSFFFPLLVMVIPFLVMGRFQERLTFENDLTNRIFRRTNSEAKISEAS